MGVADRTGVPGEEKKNKRSLGQIIDFIARIVVTVIGFPVRMMAAILAQFIGNGGAGRAVAGAAMFLLGCAISTDSLWQTLFGQRPLFPWFESGWIGWWGWSLVLLNPFFYAAFLVATAIQVVEAYTLRGKNPDAARRDLQDVQQYDLDSKPTGKIDLAEAFWHDYKRAGMRDRSTAGMIAISLWVFDLIITFSARNPLQFDNPITILQCLVFNLATMMAGEIGYTILMLTKD